MVRQEKTIMQNPPQCWSSLSATCGSSMSPRAVESLCFGDTLPGVFLAEFGRAYGTSEEGEVLVGYKFEVIGKQVDICRRRWPSGEYGFAGVLIVRCACAELEADGSGPGP